MTGSERGFLLLGSRLGNPERKPLSTAQLRRLAERVRWMDRPGEDRDLTADDLQSLGYGEAESRRILALLSEEELLSLYLHTGTKSLCKSMTWVSREYPGVLRDRLGDDSPAVLWALGDTELLHGPKIALVGSRDILPMNRAFAGEVGRQAALQGYTLVSGNARGSDAIAQRACLKHGGRVISVLADSLQRQHPRENVLFLSEQDFDADFTAQRALSRNRVIHALADKVMVAQCSLARGGTWDGTVRNLRHGWSPVFCYNDGTESCFQLESLGAQRIEIQQLSDFSALNGIFMNLFDQ